MTKEELDVFLSSDQEEFARLRNSLSKKEWAVPFLTCTPLENRGADPINVVELSLKAVRDSDIYVGIFGRKYSETTIKEYTEAVKCRKPCFTYVKKLNKRETKLSEFIEENLKNEFHYFEFRVNKDLIAQIDDDLRRFIFETLRIGLEERKRKKEETKSIEEKAEKAISTSSKRPPTMASVEEPLKTAELAFKKGNNLECLVLTTVKLEDSLQKALVTTDTRRRVMSLGQLILSAQKAQLFNTEELDSLRTISYYRNIAVHLGDTPPDEKIRWILENAKKILSRLDVKKQTHTRAIDVPTFSDIDRIVSTEEMQNYRKIIYENAEVIKQAKNLSPELTRAINYVATRHDRVAVILKDRQNDKKRILEWIGEDTLLKTWKIIEAYIDYERHRRNNPNFVLYYEQLMKEYEKEKRTS
jgi:hypothetical protein